MARSFSGEENKLTRSGPVVLAVAWPGIYSELEHTLLSSVPRRRMIKVTAVRHSRSPGFDRLLHARYYSL
jgi:hypothetical protein